MRPKSEQLILPNGLTRRTDRSPLGCVYVSFIGKGIAWSKCFRRGRLRDCQREAWRLFKGEKGVRA